MMCCSDGQEGKLEEVIIACLRSDESKVEEEILDKILNRRKLIDWKVLVKSRSDKVIRVKIKVTGK